MADFRRWVLALAVLAILVAPASAQPVMTCSAAAVPTLVRAEGIAELLGDIVLTCSGGAANTVISANVLVILDAGATQVTSRPTTTNTTTLESLLLLDDVVEAPVSAGVRGHVYRGTRQGTSGVAFNGVQISVPDGTTRLIRITNVRGNATTGRTQIQATVTISGSQTVLVVDPTVDVAFISTGLTSGGATLRDADLSGFDFKNIQQCVGVNTQFDDDPAEPTFVLRFTENFATAFKRRVAAATGQPVPGAQALINTESGLTLSGDSVTGWAHTGTRLFVRFADVPANTRVFVSRDSLQKAFAGTAALTDDVPAVARWVHSSPTSREDLLDVDFDTGTATRSNCTVNAVEGGGTSLTCVSGATEEVDIVEVAISDGSGTAVWEIFNTNTINTENVEFNVYVVSAAGAETIPEGDAASAIATAAGGFAPTSTTITTSSTNTPVPRFVDTAEERDAFKFIQCVTNLLFPFVTNQGGFDTGIAVVNTSQDEVADDLPFDDHSQSGRCTFYFFGQGAAGGAAPAPQTSAVVAAGSMVAFSLQGGTIPGGTAGTSNFQGFQGYIIARCNFQFAHGFAFITRIGVSELAHGYLALVFPDDNSRSATEDLDN